MPIPDDKKELLEIMQGMARCVDVMGRMTLAVQNTLVALMSDKPVDFVMPPLPDWYQDQLKQQTAKPAAPATDDFSS